MSRLRPTLESRQGDELVAHVVASADAVWFQGHFPGMPILPGVAMLALVEDVMSDLWADAHHPPVEIRAFHRIRFRQMIAPGTNLRVRVRQTQPDRFRFTVEAGGFPASTGECFTVVVRAKVEQPSLAELLPSGPAKLAARFCSDGTTVGSIADRASQLCALGAGRDRPAEICVASEDRVEVAAAALAALSGRAVALFPPALTVGALRATHGVRGFFHWLGPMAWRMELPSQLSAMHVELAERSDAATRVGLGPADQPCLFLHTGGTTGTPRSWAKTPRNLLDEVGILLRGLAVAPDDHILATVPPHHIYGLLFSVLLPLCSGATVERLSPFFPQEIADRIAGTSATILVSTPAHLKALASVMTGPHRLRLVLSSGAPLSATDARGFFAATGLWPLEVYGSTETGGIAIRRQDRDDRTDRSARTDAADAAEAAGSPWHPLPGVACRLDGDVLAVRSSFITPGVRRDADGFFATADLARLRPDGSFDLAGRADGVVKVGGKRVLLPEIEKAIVGLAQVVDAAVLALPSDSGRGQDIVALVASPRPADELLRELRELLPSPSWPRRLRTAEFIPTTPSGKRDRVRICQLLDVPAGEGTGG
jgi:acyl-CoA synthetase (AMP-forming)/AMP-acid ligase II